MEQVGVGEEVIWWTVGVLIEQSLDCLGVGFEGKRQRVAGNGALKKVGESKAGVASKKRKAKGGGTCRGVVGVADGVFEGAEGRVFIGGAKRVGLKLPGDSAAICFGAAHEEDRPRGDL